MNYESMTDFEINSAVTAKLNNCESWEVNDAEFYHCGIDGSACHSIPILDYCNDWACGGVVIQNNKLSIMLDWEVKLLYTAMGVITEKRGLGPYDRLVDFTHKNPLRAAMIVFLMMNEG